MGEMVILANMDRIITCLSHFHFPFLSRHNNHRLEITNRLAMATFWSTFIHDGKFSPGKGGGVHALPLSLYLPSRAKLWRTLQLRGHIHSSYFSSTLFFCVVITIQNILSIPACTACYTMYKICSYKYSLM